MDRAFGFTNAQIISYFVTRTADDGLPAGDFKLVNSSALSLFRCSHVQKVQVCHEITSDRIFIRVDCLPEMKKDRVYKIQMQLEEVCLKSIVLSVVAQLEKALMPVASILQHYAMLWRSFLG